MRNEGLLVGGSSGSSLSGALKWLKSEAGQRVANTEGLNVVVLLPDGLALSFTYQCLVAGADENYVAFGII